MSEEDSEAKVRNGVSLTAADWAWLKGFGDASAKLRAIVAAHRTGKVVVTGEVLQGEDGKGCIQPLEYKKPDLCPFRVAYPQLQLAKNGLVLQNEFCIKCPHYKRDYEYFKVKIRQEAKNIDNQQPAPAAATVQPPKVLEFTIKCTEAGCSKEWDSAYYEDRKDPMMDMHHAIAAHLNLAHGIGAVPHEMSPHRMQEKLKQEMQRP